MTNASPRDSRICGVKERPDRYGYGSWGGCAPPRKPAKKLSGEVPKLLLLLATELDRDVVQSYLATLATPNQLIQLTVCCSQAQLETSARPASKAAARAAVAKEEHERLMQEKRERIAAQQQARLEAEIALEELRLQRLRQREEAERLEGPFNRPARETSRDRQRRRDAEAARRVAEGPPDRGEETWVDVATARGRRPRSPSRPAKERGKTKDKHRDATPTMGGTIDPATDDDDTVDRFKGAGAAKGAAKRRGKGGWTPALDRLGRMTLATGAALRSTCPRALGQERISAAVISR